MNKDDEKMKNLNFEQKMKRVLMTAINDYGIGRKYI